MRVVIIGGGPTGLGAAWRLHERGHTDWVLLEATEACGGLASSVVDDAGFTWDLGGHVIFSHYEYYDRLLDDLLGDAWCEHEREAWVWMRDRFIPYPFQNNLWRLPPDERDACVAGLEKLAAEDGQGPPPTNFREWILASFGEGIAESFLLPYNFEVWAYDPAEMNCAWMGDRVATVDVERVKRNIAEGRDEVAWGPNATFRFPERGGTGAIWGALAARLPAERVAVGSVVVDIDASARIVRTADGAEHPYDALVSTMPMDALCRMLGWSEAADRFVWSSTHIIGVGLDGAVPDELATKCWIYFPEPEAPFYRATVFSNYSPYNVAAPGKQWSLMCEVSESPVKPVDAATVVDEVIDGLRWCRLVGDDDPIASVWHRRLAKGYPTPFLDRDEVLGDVEPRLRELGIFSRGRFGGWKYEVSNQDHSLMQGVETANHLLDGTDEVTWFRPTVVNGR